MSNPMTTPPKPPDGPIERALKQFSSRDSYRIKGEEALAALRSDVSALREAMAVAENALKSVADPCDECSGEGSVVEIVANPPDPEDPYVNTACSCCNGLTNVQRVEEALARIRAARSNTEETR